MKNILAYLFVLTIILVAVTYSYPSETRIYTLGSESNLLIDDTNIYNYPSSLEGFANRIIVEKGFYPYSDSLANLAFLKNLGKIGNVGFLFNKNDIPTFPKTSNQTIISQPYALPGIIYSVRVKDALMLGISGEYGLSANNDDKEGTNNDITNQSSVYSGTFGLSYILGEVNTIELSVKINGYRFTFTQGNNFSFKNDNNLSTVFNARFLFFLNDYLTFIPFLKFSTTDLSSIESIFGQITPTSVKRLATERKAGLGINFVPSEENRIIIGAIYNNNIYEQTITPGGEDTTITNNYIPELVGGIESDITSWFTLRAGFTKSFHTRRIQASNGITDVITDKDSPFSLSTGCGIKLGSIVIDGVLNKDFPFACGYLLSGIQQPLFTRISATYLF